MSSVRITLARAVVGIGLLALVAGVTFAQQDDRGRIWVGGGRFYRLPPKWAKESDFNGSFLYCRGFYTSVYGEAGGQGWRTDFPGADNNFSVRLAELTKVHVPLDADRQPNYVVVRLNDPLLMRCGILFMEDVGTARFSEDEVRGLRQFLLKGGFLWVDDFWGSDAWEQWTHEIARVLPPGEFPIVDIPVSHPALHTLYDVKALLQVSSIQFWYQSGGRVSERGRDSDEVHYRGIHDSRGRLMVMMTHNTDVADTWEREGENREYFDLYSPSGYAIGVDVVLYAMTH
jgi:hypothetical protein